MLPDSLDIITLDNSVRSDQCGFLNSCLRNQHPIERISMNSREILHFKSMGYSNRQRYKSIFLYHTVDKDIQIVFLKNDFTNLSIYDNFPYHNRTQQQFVLPILDYLGSRL